MATMIAKSGRAVPTLLRAANLLPQAQLFKLPLTPTSLAVHYLSTPSSIRHFTNSPYNAAQAPSIFGAAPAASPSSPATYFQRPSLPANTIIRFVPQQTAWVVERMGKFNRILQPGLTILVPIIDRIAYVKSLKEAAMEIPSQSAITADNVTLELDGVLYTRVFDAYKARCVHPTTLGNTNQRHH